MKKIIIYFILLFFYISSYSQNNNIPQPNGNISNNSLSKFEGNWFWTNGNDSIKLKLKKENVLLPFPDNSRADLIVGFHYYKKNGNVIESSLQFSNSNYSDKKSTVLGTNRNSNDTLDCTFKDLSNGKLCDLMLVINSNRTQMQWVLKNREGIKMGAYTWEFTLPKNAVLTKQ